MLSGFTADAVRGHGHDNAVAARDEGVGIICDSHGCAADSSVCCHNTSIKVGRTGPHAV